MIRTTPLVRVAEPYDDTAMKSNSTGRSIARARSAMNMNAPLRMPTSSGGLLVVVGGDLLAELADALLQLVLVDDDPADVRVVHVGLVQRCSMARRSSRGNGACRDVTRTRSSIR